MNCMRSLIAFLLCLLLAGCTKEFNIHSGNTRPKYVIQGRVSSMRAPYFVRITLSTDASTIADRSTPSLKDSSVGVEGALVIISDGAGLSDTLKPCTDDNTS